MKTRVLTVRRPWAGLIVTGVKDVESRTWKPSQPLRLLIHCGKQGDPEAINAPVIHTSHVLTHGSPPDGPPGDRFPGVQATARYEEMILGKFEVLPGHIIGAVLVTSWSRDSESPWAVPGLWHWQLTGPATCTPIPHRGMPGLSLPPQGWEDAF